MWSMSPARTCRVGRRSGASMSRSSGSQLCVRDVARCCWASRASEVCRIRIEKALAGDPSLVSAAPAECVLGARAGEGGQEAVQFSGIEICTLGQVSSNSEPREAYSGHILVDPV